ncbi:MAG: hypothetical protein ACOX76_00030 [Lachnospiraceae bacterium]|jgi:hypothetical protein
MKDKYSRIDLNGFVVRISEGKSQYFGHFFTVKYYAVMGIIGEIL